MKARENIASAKTYDQLTKEDWENITRPRRDFDDVLLGFIMGACVVGVIAVLL